MTITVRIPDSQEADLRALLEAKGLTLSDFVREAIAEKLGREAARASAAAELGKHLFGRHGSGRSDLARDRKAILAEVLDAKHRR
jgi:RHH-type transcriptional regulator, rel operon repressor / antitoxin RelB